MFKNKYLVLKKVYCRAHHLSLGFPILLDIQEAKALNYDLLQIAKREQALNLLGYINIESPL